MSPERVRPAALTAQGWAAHVCQASMRTGPDCHTPASKPPGCAMGFGRPTCLSRPPWPPWPLWPWLPLAGQPRAAWRTGLHSSEVLDEPTVVNRRASVSRCLSFLPCKMGPILVPLPCQAGRVYRDTIQKA